MDLSSYSGRLADAARPYVDNVVVHRFLDSTQASALRLIDQAENEDVVVPPTLIVAVEQRAGSGRGGRAWQSPAGGLYLSWLSAELDTATVARLPMLAAVAACDALRALGIDRVEIKWPNDLLIGGRKLAGLLSHARHGEATWATVGLGVNLSRTPTIDDPGSPPAASVADHLGEGDDEDRAARIVGGFVQRLAAGVAAPDESVQLWRDRLLHRRGDPMTVRLGDGRTLDGSFAGVDADGHLQLEVDGEPRTISTGDVLES